MTSPEQTDLGTRAVLRELVASIQGLDKPHRHLLEQGWRDSNTLALICGEPGLAAVYDSLRALVLELRRVAGET